MHGRRCGDRRFPRSSRTYLSKKGMLHATLSPYGLGDCNLIHRTAHRHVRDRNCKLAESLRLGAKDGPLLRVKPSSMIPAITADSDAQSSRPSRIQFLPSKGMAPQTRTQASKLRVYIYGMFPCQKAPRVLKRKGQDGSPIFAL